LLLDPEVAQKQKFVKGTVLEGTLEYAKEKGDDRGITVTVEWEGAKEGEKVKGSVVRTMA
jgi:protein arginine N-methyltransferase 3